MLRIHGRLACALLVAVAAAGLSACKSSNEGSWIGTGVGTAAGAGAGYAIGGSKGAVIGAGVGALGGYIVGTELGYDDTAAHEATEAHRQALRYWDSAQTSPNPHDKLRWYRMAWDADPTHAEIRNNMGLAFLELGDRGAARGEFEAALRVDPDYEPARENLRRINLN